MEGFWLYIGEGGSVPSRKVLCVMSIPEGGVAATLRNAGYKSLIYVKGLPEPIPSSAEAFDLTGNLNAGHNRLPKTS